MKLHNLTQGSPEWHAYRKNHFNASDAPAMMGVSAYKSRSQLLKELHTGMTEEIDAGTQRLFDAGHRFEALARPLAESIMKEDLYPIVGSMGVYSASFDGCTMGEDKIFEHKTLNAELKQILQMGDILPLQYRIQMEQQLMVSGAEDCMFMASKWDGDDLVEECHCWYYPDLELRAKIIAGWEQFSIDLVGFKPEEKKVEHVGHTPDQLPALRIEVTGMVTASNLAEFKATAMAAISNVNRELSTDQDFADAEKSVKWCAEVEERLAAAKQHALSQTSTIDELFKAIDDIAAEARRTRLELDKLVKARKDAVRMEIVQESQKVLADHVANLNVRIGKPYMPFVQADFGGAVKGKRTIDSVRDAVATTLANAKIEANAIADRIQINLNSMPATHAVLFADLAQLVLKPADDFQLVVKSRIAEHQAAINAKLEEEAAKQTAAAKPVMVMHGNLPVSMEQFNATYAPKPKPGAAPELKLGKIAERLGFTLTADFLTTLGFEPAGTAGAAKLYHEADFPRICAALIDHISSICVPA
jgi:putative phage-type endonuclease